MDTTETQNSARYLGALMDLREAVARCPQCERPLTEDIHRQRVRYGDGSVFQAFLGPSQFYMCWPCGRVYGREILTTRLRGKWPQPVIYGLWRKARKKRVDRLERLEPWFDWFDIGGSG